MNTPLTIYLQVGSRVWTQLPRFVGEGRFQSGGGEIADVHHMQTHIGVGGTRLWGIM